MNEKVDADRDPYYVLGACNPEMADRALDAAREMVGLFPCNAVVWEEAPGRQVVYHVSIVGIGRLFGIARDDEEFHEVIEETGAMVEEAFAAL